MAKDVKAKYVIVNVDKVLNCPIYVGITDFCKVNVCGCDDCKMKTEKGNYGDTKEQLIKKVAQVIYKQEVEYYKGFLTIFDEGHYKLIYEKSLDTAKKIIEFLGVEDGRKNI